MALSLEGELNYIPAPAMIRRDARHVEFGFNKENGEGVADFKLVVCGNCIHW